MCFSGVLVYGVGRLPSPNFIVESFFLNDDDDDDDDNEPYLSETVFNNAGALHCNWGYCAEINSNQIAGWFLRRGENRSTWQKTSWCRVENQQTQCTCDAKY